MENTKICTPMDTSPSANDLEKAVVCQYHVIQSKNSTKSITTSGDYVIRVSLPSSSDTQKVSFNVKNERSKVWYKSLNDKLEVK